MPDGHSNVGNRRMEALARCLAPCCEGGAQVDFVADLGARHELTRALCSGFREAVGARLADLAGEVEEVDLALDALPERWWFDSNKLRVVVTGFGPFLDHTRNPSWEVAQSFAEVLSEQFSVSCECVPVTYDEAARFAGRHHIEHGQRLVVHFGLAASRTEVALERYAHNCRGTTRDESGEREAETPNWPDRVVPGGPVALETLLDVRQLAAELDQATRPGAKVSRDVGEYVCNAIYYHSLQAVSAARQAGRAAEALFVHVPPVAPEGAESVGTHFGQIFGAHLVELLDA